MINNKILLINEEFANDYPTPDTIISYSSDGEALSLFKDNIWDFSAYIHSPLSNKLINFDFFNYCKNIELRNKIIYEYKLIIYGFIYCNTNNLKSVSISTICTGHAYALRSLFKIAIDCNTSLNNLSNNNFLIKKIFLHLSFISRERFGDFSHIFKKMSALSIIFQDHNFNLTIEQERFLSKIKYKLNRPDVKQHLVVTTDLYFRLILLIDDKLDEFKKISEKIFKTLLSDDFNLYINSNDIDSNIQSFYSKNNLKNTGDLKIYINKITDLALTKIIMFSGMRHSEALLLPYDCLESIIIKNKTIYILNGYTSKLTKSGPIKVTWISSHQVKVPVEILQKISRFYLDYLNVDFKLVDKNKLPLTLYETYKYRKRPNPIYDFNHKRIIRLKRTLNYFNFDSKIDEKSLKELELTTSISNLSKYNIEIGLDFPFTPHQFRRSLTVYAARSGLVNIPALKAQLKHIKHDMTLYYANNSLKALNLFDDELTESFREEVAMDGFLNFKEDVIDSLGKIYGGEGSRLQNAKDSSMIPLFLSDEKIALQDIKEGKMVYRRTPLGGCSRIGDCYEITELNITSCLSCKDSIFSDRTIRALEIARKNFKNQLNNICKDNPFYKHLQDEIDQIELFLNKHQKN
ncbi:site-specific integrase [Acinetobacter soli]|uniref:site-specific integrase n=1 Tax=Acinetobacter soli TaxID=487316 RepID=UPI000DD0C7AD|nr:site-specific integrase [Acinetobacter soli]